jgi:50S ribosomal protein L16 3-hydroxylase
MTTVLGGMSPAAFLRDHWQKRPLLVRQAVPGFAGIIERDALLALATRDDCSSRLVIQHPRRRGRGRWERHDGPFGGLDASMLPASHWTLLVHGLESLVPGGWELLRRFAFVPMARIDDLMISYATDGGGVGPHDDLYDVFLLQGPGRRRWQLSTQRDRRLDDQAAIRVLADFRAEEEHVLEPGDMLYLPPGVAHFGVAEGPCFTYSIGFLAPSHRDLLQHFCGYLGAALAADVPEDALYEDPDLRVPRAPLALGDAMIDRVADVLARIRWDRADVGDFLGRFLTMPKPRVRFAPPRRPVDVDAFARRLRGRGALALALPTRGLVRGQRVYLNGQGSGVRPATRRWFETLVRERRVALPARLDDEALALAYEWYAAGYLTVR